MGTTAAEAYAPWRTEVKGQRIAVIGATQVLDTRAHHRWTGHRHPGRAGVGQGRRPPGGRRARGPARQRHRRGLPPLGHRAGIVPQPAAEGAGPGPLQAAGADIIVGGHAHVLLGGGLLDNAFVDYGLGNYFFYATAGNRADSGVVTVTDHRSPHRRLPVPPAHISGGQARALTGPAADHGRRGLERLAPVHRPHALVSGRARRPDPGRGPRPAGLHRRLPVPVPRRRRGGPPTRSRRFLGGQRGRRVAQRAGPALRGAGREPGGVVGDAGAAAAGAGFRVVGAHTDSPNLRVKPRPDGDASGWRRSGSRSTAACC